MTNLKLVRKPILSCGTINLLKSMVTCVNTGRWNARWRKEL